MAVGAGAFLSIRHFRTISACNTSALQALTDVRADVNYRNALEWQAIAQEKIGPDTIRQLDVQAAGVVADIDRFGALKGVDEAARINGAFAAYAAAVSTEFRLLQAGRVEEAKEVDEAQVDPAFEALGTMVETLAARTRVAKAEASEAERRASWIIGTTAAVFMAWFVAMFVRMRNRAVAQTVQQAALEAQVSDSEQRAAEREFEANHDALTGLPNRRFFLRAVERETIGQGVQVAVMLIDLDGFKNVNDTLGHRSGDEMLRQVGARIRSVLRDEDVLARLGGDEFAVLVPAERQISSDGALALADRIHAALEATFTVDSVPLSVGGSIGIAVGPHGGQAADTLLQHADIAMYAAKAGGDGSQLYAPDTDPHSLDQLMLPGELRQGLTRDEVHLHYQPKLDLASGAVLGVEALVRWNHPRRGLLMPGEFLPVIERSGLMRLLTSQVLKLAVAQVASWADQGITMRVAVNISAADLRDVELADEVERVLAEHGVEGRHLQLEVTENVFVTAPELVALNSARLAELGVTLSLDDFGTGYSSLTHLRDLSVDELKIDRSFVKRVGTNAFDTAVVRSTVALGQSLGLRVVGEGVEDAEALNLLSVLNCDEAQGYFIQRPAPPEVLTAWLLARVGRAGAPGERVSHPKTGVKHG
jgi:diguanylate cyclase (GGDEF)-like protein